MTIDVFQAIIQERDDERERLRVQLARSREQVSALLSTSSSSTSVVRRTSSVSAACNSPGGANSSRPASFISVEESSGPELSEKNHESEDDGK